MIEKYTKLDRIEILSNGAVQFRLGLRMMEDGRQIDCKWHRSAIDLDTDVDAQVALVNAHLAELGALGMPAGDIAQLKSHVELTRSSK